MNDPTAYHLKPFFPHSFLIPLSHRRTQQTHDPGLPSAHFYTRPLKLMKQPRETCPEVRDFGVIMTWYALDCGR